MFSKSHTVEVSTPDETPAGETTVRRNKISRYALTETPHPAIRTVYDLFQFNAARWGDNPCFGTRRVIKLHFENDSVTTAGVGSPSPPASAKPRMFWELGPFEYRSYKQAAEEGIHIW